MKIPPNVIVYDGQKKLKSGSECPKHLEETLHQALNPEKPKAAKKEKEK